MNMMNMLQFNIFKKLSILRGVDSDNQVRIQNISLTRPYKWSMQCGSGIWAHPSRTNIKQGESDRVVAVISIVQEPELQTEYTKLSCALIVIIILGAHLLTFCTSPTRVKMTLYIPTHIPRPPHQSQTPQKFISRSVVWNRRGPPQVQVV